MIISRDLRIVVHDPGRNSSSFLQFDGKPDRIFEAHSPVSATNKALESALSEAALSEAPMKVAILRRGNSIDAMPIESWARAMAIDPMIGMVVADPLQKGSKSDLFRYLVIGRSDDALVCSRLFNDFGFLDERYDTVASALDDLMIRANACGYRCIGAWSPKEVISESRVHHRDWRKLNAAHPHLFNRLRRALNRKPHFSEITPKVTPSIVPERRIKSIGFDLTNLRMHHDGTSELAKKVLHAFDERYRNEIAVRFWAAPETLAFHGLEQREDAPDTPEAAFRFGQFQAPGEIVSFVERAPILGAFFLDTIALDCLYLDGPNFSNLWADGFSALDFVIFNSAFTERQARLRFGDMIPRVATGILHSTDTREYARQVAGEPPAEGSILVIGNRFAHKDLLSSVRRLISETDRPVKVLGIASEPIATAQFLPSGKMSESEIEDLFRAASVVLFPSHYEGFGFPIMHALAAGRPVVARDLPVFREIKAASPEALNIHLCPTSGAMVRKALEASLTWTATRSGAVPVRWEATAEGIVASALAASISPKSAGEKADLISSMYPRHSALRYGRRTARLLRSAEKRLDRLIAPAASYFGLV